MRQNLRRALRALLALALLAMPVAAASAAQQPAPPTAAAAAVATPATAVPATAGPATTAAAVIPATAAPMPATTTAEPHYAELPNFHRVDEHVLRGGQPGTTGFATLKKLGVHTILNLRFEPDQGRDEEAAAKAQGLAYVSIRMYPLLPPSWAQMRQALALLDDPHAWPVFVHCQAGSDRTGVVIASYRIANAGWTAKRAIDEAMGYGMNPLEVLKRQFIRSFYDRTAERLAQASAGKLAVAAAQTAAAAAQPASP